MTKNRILPLISATLVVSGILLTAIYFQRFRPLVADSDTSYLNLDDIGVTVLIGADTAIIFWISVQRLPMPSR